MRGRLVAVGAVALALSGCAASSGEKAYEWSPGPVSTPSKTVSKHVQVELEVLPEETVAKEHEDVVTVRLAWTNTTRKEQSGNLQTHVWVPRGVSVKEAPGCHGALVNDLVCDAEVVLAPGASVERVIVFSVPHEGASLTGLTARVSGGSEASLSGE